MRRLALSLTLMAAVACSISVLAAPANAQCYSSTGSNQTFPDSAADGEFGLAPEILGVVAVTDSNCGIAVAPVINGAPDPGELITGESVGTYLDTDGNPATGDPLFNGADKVVIVVGELGSDLPPGLGTWNGSSFSFAGGPALTPVAGAGFVSTFDQLGVPNPTTLGIRTISLYQGIYDNYSDFAPEVGAASFGFPVAFSSTPPAISPPATGYSPATAPVSRCRVPALRGRTLTVAARRLRRAGCHWRIVRVRSRVRTGRVVSTTPGVGHSTGATVAVRVSRGHRRTARISAVGAYASIEHQLSAAARS